MRSGRGIAVAATMVAVTLSTQTASAKPAACPAARFVIPGAALIAGEHAPKNDQIEIADGRATIASGCGPATVKLKAKKKFTLVVAKFASCAGISGKAMLVGKIPAPACDTLKGFLATKKAKPKKRKFTANRAPLFHPPPGMVVGPAGGTFTNPDDGTQVTVPPGAFAETAPAVVGGRLQSAIGPRVAESATVSVVEVPITDVMAMEHALGIVPPSNAELVKGLQVMLGPSDPRPSLALTASIPEPPGLDPNATLIHTLIEPTFVDGIMDGRESHLIYDGPVTRGDNGRLYVEIAPQQFPTESQLPAGALTTLQASATNCIGGVGCPCLISPCPPPGRDCFVIVPPMCPIDGVVRDTNGSPVANALVFVQGAVLTARTDRSGFFRFIIGPGTFNLVALSGTASGQASVSCTSNEKLCVPIVIAVAANPAVPRVQITMPSMDVQVPAGQTTYAIEGTVASVNPVTQATIETHVSETANPSVQTAAVTEVDPAQCGSPAPAHCGQFTATVILTSGAPNTVVAIATDGQLTGSDSRILFTAGVQPDDLRFTLTWDTQGTDLDLYVRTPGGNTIYYARRNGDGGTQDVDDVDGFGPENIVFPVGMAGAGTYGFAVEYFSGAPTISTATITVRLRGRVIGRLSAAIGVSQGTSPIASADPNAVFNAGSVVFPGPPGQLPGPPLPQSDYQ